MSQYTHYTLKMSELRDAFMTSLVVQWLRIACQFQGHSFDSWSGKISHATGKLSLCATTTKPCSRGCAQHQEKSLQLEKACKQQ